MGVSARRVSYGVEVQTASGEEAAQAESLGWGVAYGYYESHYEHETTDFSNNVILHEDGRAGLCSSWYPVA